MKDEVVAVRPRLSRRTAWRAAPSTGTFQAAQECGRG